MDEFGKSPLLAITALMTSAAMAAVGLVLQPPEGTPEPQISVAMPSPLQAPPAPEPPPQVARLTPAPEALSTAPPTVTLPRTVPSTPPRPMRKPFAPGPYVPAPTVTIPSPPVYPDGLAPPAVGGPAAMTLAALPTVAQAPSLSGASPPPRPGGKPLPPPLDYAPGPYAPRLLVTLPRAPVGPEPAGAAPAADQGRAVASLPRSLGAEAPSLRGALPPPRPGGKPPPPLQDFGTGPYASPLAVAIPTPPSHTDEAPDRPGESILLVLSGAPKVSRARLPSLRDAARPPHPEGKPLRLSDAAPAVPYAPSPSLTIPSPPVDLYRLASPPDPETVIAQSLTPPAVEAELPTLERAAPPPMPSVKPEYEREVAALTALPTDRSRAATGQPVAGPAPSRNGYRAEDVEARLPPWRRYAALTPPDDGRPMVAIILDDLGMNLRRMDRVVALPTPLTLAILPYASGIDGWAGRARAAGHELMLHLPMEPSSGDEYPGPNALLADLEPSEIERRIEWSLARFEGYVGVNNHMGSRFTANEELMQLLMVRLRDRGLLFVDSLTTSASVGSELARSFGIPTASRDIFLDNEIDSARIAAQLAKVERCARRKGYCIAIGHPHLETLAVLERWLPTLQSKGLQLVPISAIIARRMTG